MRASVWALCAASVLGGCLDPLPDKGLFGPAVDAVDTTDTGVAVADAVDVQDTTDTGVAVADAVDVQDAIDVETPPDASEDAPGDAVPAPDAWPDAAEVSPADAAEPSPGPATKAWGVCGPGALLKDANQKNRMLLHLGPSVGPLQSKL